MKNKIDLVVSFDTTGSMYPVLAQVRREVESFVKNMFSEFKDLRLGIIAHGDYCDKDNPYTIRAMELTRDEKELCKFVRETKQTWGGDTDECYELVINTAHSVMNWREDAEKIMLMIGDASPHSPSYPQNKDNLDWKEETEELRKQGIKVFSVHALAHYRSSSKAFYKYVAENTSGIYLTLDMFNEIVDLIKATVYQQGGEEKLNEFVTIIKDSGRMTRSMENNFKRLRGEEVEDTYESYRRKSSRKTSSRKSSEETVSIKEMDKLVPVMPGRFQIMTVDENTAIKQFVESNGIEFKTGRGFYELSKAETVQQYKEVIIMDRETGEMFNGSQVREELGLQPQSEKGGVKERIHKSAADKYRVFIQSTSVNRKLIAGTTFLYEVSDLEDTGTVIETLEKSDVEDTLIELDKHIDKTDKTLKEADDVLEKADKILSEPDVSSIDIDETLDVIDETIKKLEGEAAELTKAIEESKKIIEDSEEALSKLTEDRPEIFNTNIDSSVFEEIKIDTSKTKVKAKSKAKPKEKTKAKPAKAFSADRMEKQLKVVESAIERYTKSTNKKNKEFIKNNLNKLIKEAQKMLNTIE